MKIKSLVAIVARAESAKDRRLAIRQSWSLSEREERRKIAVDSQVRLAGLISKGKPMSKQIEESQEIAACC